LILNRAVASYFAEVAETIHVLRAALTYLRKKEKKREGKKKKKGMRYERKLNK